MTTLHLILENIYTNLKWVKKQDVLIMQILTWRSINYELPKWITKINVISHMMGSGILYECSPVHISTQQINLCQSAQLVYKAY